MNLYELNGKIIQKLKDMRNDPLAFVKWAFDWGYGDLAGQDGPDIWQVEVLEDVKRQLAAGARQIQLAVASGHGVGKSALVAWLTLWAMSTRPNLAGVITANTLGQLKDKTWAELARWHKRAINAHWFKWSATRFVMADRPESWFVSATPWSKENPEAFAGLHADNVLIIMDEASAVPDIIWETVDGAMTTPGAMMFVFGNPTRNTGRFRECFGRFRHRWSVYQVDSRTAKMVDQAKVQQWIDDYGEDSDFVRVRVRGVFPNVGDMQFIASELAEGARARALEVDAPSDQPLIMAIDVARFGDDQSVFAFRRGRDARSIPWKKFRGLSTVQLTNRAVEAINMHKPDAIFIDGGGVGGGPVDMLVEQRRVRGVVEVNFGGKADRKVEHGGDYAHKGAEMWDSMRAWLSIGAIPDDHALLDGLTGREYGFDRLDRLMLEKKQDMKKRGLASPDEADALALTFAQPVVTARRIAARPRFYEMN